MTHYHRQGWQVAIQDKKKEQQPLLRLLELSGEKKPMLYRSAVLAVIAVLGGMVPYWAAIYKISSVFRSFFYYFKHILFKYYTHGSREGRQRGGIRQA